jgi:hypothetical protein
MNSAIQYSQQRPIDGINEPRRLPLAVDCSGFVTLCYSWTADPKAPDPNGRGYDGIGYTGTIFANCVLISLAEARPGDLVLFGPYSGEHVALLTEVRGDPMLASHGAHGPRLIRLHDEAMSHYPPVRFLRVPGMPDDASPDLG